ncbi:MAG: TetR/AcrR family transcriptional regulator [Actinomycetota bacterium]|nr:TetR/AcrR family transcriptional regulator [Actinomycetota bacterium]
MASVKNRLSLRDEQAGLTRRRILGAAARVFEEQGFAGTRIEDIAAEAGVAVPTVYKVFTNKVNLLIGALNQAMAGDDAAAMDQQAWFTEQLDEPDPVRQLQLIARNARRIYERAGQLLSVLRAAAPLDPELAQAWQDIAAQRLERSRRTGKNLAPKAPGRHRISRDETATTLWALTEPELFTTYTTGKRTADQYEAWLADILRRSLLD